MRLVLPFYNILMHFGGYPQGVEHVLACLQRLLWSFRVKLLTPNPTRSGYDSYGAVRGHTTQSQPPKAGLLSRCLALSSTSSAAPSCAQCHSVANEPCP